jgi:hypothetical protein
MNDETFIVPGFQPMHDHSTRVYEAFAGPTGHQPPTPAQEAMQYEFKEAHPVEQWTPSIFERALFCVFATMGIITCFATLYFYYELYSFVVHLSTALQQIKTLGN